MINADSTQKTHDFFKDIKDRLSNPFFISFIISWLIYNWPIVITVVLYNSYALKADGYVSFYDMINQSQNTCRMIWYPLISGIAYCVIYPWIKAGFEWIQANANSWSETEVIKATESGWMPFKRYIELRDIMQENINQLQDLNKEQSGLTIENNKLKTDILDLDTQIRGLESEIQEKEFEITRLIELTSVNKMDGYWAVEIKDENGKEHSTTWMIEKGAIKNYEDNVATIDYFIVNPFKGQAAMSFKEVKTDKIHSYILDRNPDFSILKSIKGDQRGIETIFMSKTRDLKSIE